MFTVIWTGRAGQVGAGWSGAGSGGSQVGGLVRRVAGYGYCTVIFQTVLLLLQLVSIYNFTIVSLFVN